MALSNGKDGLALCVERRRISPLQDFLPLEKIGEIIHVHHHQLHDDLEEEDRERGTETSSPEVAVYMGFAGLAADGRRVLDKTRLYVENYRLKHAETASMEEVAHFIAGTSECRSVGPITFCCRI